MDDTEELDDLQGPSKGENRPPAFAGDHLPTPVIDSDVIIGSAASNLLRVEYHEDEPGAFREDTFDRHHIVLNLLDRPQPVETVRDGERFSFPFGVDEVIVTPAGMRVSFEWKTRSSVIIVRLDPHALERFAETEAGVLLTDTQLRETPHFHDPELVATGSAMKDALTRDDVGRNALFSALARVFLVQLIRRYGEKRATFPAGGALAANAYGRVLDLITERFAEALTVEDLAAAASMSTSHFARQFRDAVGQTPMAFVTQYRIDMAKEQLKDANRPITTIALACGFADQPHFSRTFKRVVGLTPKAFRRALNDA